MGLSSQLAPSAIAKPGVIANAAARPASPYDGQAVYQQDIDGLLIWNGSAWYPPGNMPWGVVSYIKRTAGNFSVTTTMTDVTGISATFTAVANRAYKVTYSAQVRKNTLGYLEFKLTDGSNNLYYDFFENIGDAQYAPITFSVIVTGLSGSSTIKVRAAVENGTGTVYADANNPSSFIVEDIGPA